MSAVRLLARPALVAGAALLTVGWFAAPAAAASVSVRLDGLPGRMVAGGGAAGLRGLVSNPKPETISEVEIVYTIRLDGLETSQVRFTKVVGAVQVSGGGGEVRAVDTARLLRGRATMAYSLQFLSDAPAGRATLTMEAFLRGGERLGSTRDTTTVQSTRTTASASPEPTPTLALGPADAQPGAVNSPVVAPRAASGGDDGDNGLWPLYVLGILLVLGGGGAAAFLLLKRPRDGEEEEYGGPPYSGAHAHVDAPTAILPVLPAPGGYDAGYPTRGAARGEYPNRGRPASGAGYPASGASDARPAETGRSRPGRPFTPSSSRTEAPPPADDPWRDAGRHSG